MPAPSTDFAAVRAIIARLVSLGYRITGATDATREDFPNGVTPYAVARYVCNYADDCNVYVRDAGNNRYRLYFVLGNDPDEVLADYAAPTEELLDKIRADLEPLYIRWDS